MEGVIQKWGNSNAIRLPKPLLMSMNLKENDRVSLTTSGEELIIRKVERSFQHKTLKSRLAEAGVMADFRIDAAEIDTTSVGGEVFW